jgi:hypothetical protein
MNLEEVAAGHIVWRNTMIEARMAIGLEAAKQKVNMLSKAARLSLRGTFSEITEFGREHRGRKYRE